MYRYELVPVRYGTGMVTGKRYPFGHTSLPYTGTKTTAMRSDAMLDDYSTYRYRYSTNRYNSCS